MLNCKICNKEAEFFSKAYILNKYDISYYRCTNCGFICTEEPYWLDEAYNNPIGISDIGIIARNMHLQEVLSAIFKDMLGTKCFGKKFLDYGSGYGIFVRMMRDNGFEFWGYDRYCENLFSREFCLEEDQSGSKFDFITTFEVMEHIPDPVKELETMFNKSNNIIFTTELIPKKNPPRPKDWWYYCLDHGQHVSFYTKEALEILAEKYNKKLTTNNSAIHIFSDFSYSQIKLKIFSRMKFAKIYNIIFKNKSLLYADYQNLIEKLKGI